MSPDSTIVIPVRTGDWSRRMRLRAWLDRHPAARLAWRVLVAIVGLTVIAVGLVLVPLPGPGWLIVFAGLWILGIEFATARRARDVLKRALSAIAARFRRWRTGRRTQVG